MKNLLSISAFLALTLCACNNQVNKNQVRSNDTTSQTFSLDTTTLKSGGIFYQCPMDPEVISNKTGNCPKCGMELSEMKKK